MIFFCIRPCLRIRIFFFSFSVFIMFVWCERWITVLTKESLLKLENSEGQESLP